jgi:hypothetical protein
VLIGDPVMAGGRRRDNVFAPVPVPEGIPFETNTNTHYLRYGIAKPVIGQPFAYCIGRKKNMQDCGSRDLKATASHPVATSRLKVGLSVPCRLCGHWEF